MQIQKHLYRISQRALKSENAGSWVKSIFYTFSLLATLFTLSLIYGHAIVLNNNNDVSKCIINSKLQIYKDNIYMVSEQQFSNEELAFYKQKSKLMSNISECTIILNKNTSADDDYALTFGWDQVAIFMKPEKRDKMNYNNVTIALKQVRPLRKFMYNFEILITNELLDNPLKVFPFTDKMLIIKSRLAYVYHVSKILTTSLKIQQLMKVIFFYTIISVVTSLYIYGTIVAAPAVILLILKISRCIRPDGMNEVYKLFPWIGIHAIIRQTSPTPIIKESSSQICKAMLFYFLFLYLVYYASIIFIDKKLFVSHIQLGFQQILFGYVALAEFAAIVFMRTRTFIKYYPSFHTLIVISILYYAQICDFGFKKLVCYTGFSLSGTLFTWMILNLEIPAHTTWDEHSLNTPREDRPRVGYFPLFNMNWLKNLPDQWTLLMPLFSRQNFNASQMALVDRNNEQLTRILGNS